MSFATIEAECHFVEVCGEMFGADLVPASNDAALQQREGGLNCVCRNTLSVLISDIFSGIMIDNLVFLIPDGILVGGEAIRNKHVNIGRNILSDVLSQGSTLCILGVEKSQIAIALPNANDYFFVVHSATAPLAAILSANIGFVHFDGTVQHWPLSFFHSRTDAMAEVPRGLIAHAQSPLDLISGHSFLRLTEQQHSEKPLLQRQVGVVEDRAGSHRELIVTLLAIEKLFRGREFNDWHLAAQAFNASRPPKAHKKLSAFFVGVEQVYNIN